MFFKDFKYEYTTIEDENEYSNKYEDRTGSYVKAVYSPAISTLDEGNIFVEALPRMRLKERLSLDATEGIKNFDHDVVIRKSFEDKVALLSDLYSVRVQLPIQGMLDGLFSNILLRVYRAREYRIVKEKNIINYKNGETSSGSYAYGKIAEAPTQGFSLLGYAGSGKTSMIKTMLGHYPQVIVHEDENHRFLQVLYIVCSANSSSQNDFAAVLNDIARQVDIALGYDEGLYYQKMMKMSNYDKKIGLVKQLITMYNIGSIIIDEIQALDFKKNNKETYSKLLQICNDTKVGFIMVGTEEAYTHMFDSLHMSRRFPPIKASSYTGNLAFTSYFLRILLRYQWFDEEIKVPKYGETDETFDDIVRAFHECTYGIAALVVGLYEKINFEYLIRSRKPEITGDFVRKTFKKYYGEIDKIIDGLDRKFSYNNVKSSIQLSQTRKDEILSELATRKEIQALTSADKQDESEIRATLMASVERSILMCLGQEFSEIQIKNATKKVVAKKDAVEKSETEITQEVIELLKRKPKPKKQKALPSQVTDFLSKA